MTRPLPRGARAALILALGILLCGADSASLDRRAPAGRAILYYRDASGAPYWLATPKKDAQGRDYVPVHDDEEPALQSSAAPKPSPSTGARRVLYYRNPMGLPDTSPVPKKDSMGMDYIPVYADEMAGDGNTVTLSPEKIQRSGVRTEAAALRVVAPAIRAAGTVELDESRITVVTVRSEGYVEDLFVNKTGAHVEAGAPLFRFYSPDIQKAQIDLFVSLRAASRGGMLAGNTADGAMQRLRNLGVPESHIRAIKGSGQNPRTLDWPSPVTGEVIAKRILNGQRVMPGDELYRIADTSHLWVIADVAESDLPAIAVGSHAAVTIRAYAAAPYDGLVSFIYPMLKPETRTAQVRIEVPNPEGRLKVDMYADVVFRPGGGAAPVVAVPASAVIDSGTRQLVLVARGSGRFEPRPVKLGRRGDGYVEISEGLNAGEGVVTSANFLIDAESSLKAALTAFSQAELAK